MDTAVTDIRRLSSDEQGKYERQYLHGITLPSRGLLYDVPGFSGDIIISPMTVAEEKILGAQKGDRLAVLDTIIQRCIVDCPVKYDDLLLGDTFYILMCVRNITYGAGYGFNVTCSRCATQYLYHLKIPEDFKITGLAEEDAHEPYSVNLPLSGDTIRFNLLRNRDEIEIRRYVKGQYNKSVVEGDPAYCYRLATFIFDINGGQQTLLERLNYVESLIGNDSLAFRNAINDREFGPSIVVNLTCPSCGCEDEEILPFGKEFFRPGKLSK